jgi:hypothetical protein
MIHETGHVLAFRAWGVSGEKWNEWKAAAQSDGWHASRYATNAPSEDFSETLVVYQQTKGTPQGDELRALMPARFKLIEKLLGEAGRP